MNRLSDLYGKRIYDAQSNYIGTAHDVLIDPEDGKIKFLIKSEVSSILGREREDARKFVKDNFIPFEKVVAVRDIIIVR